jgi:autotransporter-associated beta strand protein
MNIQSKSHRLFSIIKLLAKSATSIPALLVAGLLLLAPAAQAATLTWDSTPGGAINDGAGTWLAAGQWNNGAPSATWASGDNAIIGNGGAAGTITLGNVTAGTVTFATFTGNYILTGGILNQSGGVTISGNGNVTINTTLLAGAGGITKSGSGTLTLFASDGNGGLIPVPQFTGVTTVTAGTIVYSTSGFNNGDEYLLFNSAYDTTGSTGGAGLNITGATNPWFGGLTGNVNLATAIAVGYGSVASVNLNVANGNSYTYSGIIANGAAGMQLAKQGYGTQTLTGANTYSGATTVKAGTLALSGASGAALSSAFTVRGATLLLDNSGGTWVNRLADGTALSLGSLTLKSFDGAGTQSETVGTTTFATPGKITINNGTSGTDRTDLILGTAAAVTRSAGAAIDFVGTGGTLGGGANSPNVTSFSLPANASGILPWGTVNGTLWAENNANSIRAYSGTFVDPTSVASDGTKNAQLTGSGTIAAAKSFNSLNVISSGAGQSLNLSANTGNLTLTSIGSILKSGANAYAISSSGSPLGNITAGTELITHVDGGDLTISAPLNTAIVGLAKGGSGNLILSGTRAGTMSGAIGIAGGQLEFQGLTTSLTGVIRGAGGLTCNLNAGQMLTINNTGNTYSGPTIVKGGIMRIATAWNAIGFPGSSQWASPSRLEISNAIVCVAYVNTFGVGAGPGQFQITGGTAGFSATDAVTFYVNGRQDYEIVWGALGEGAATGYFNPSVFVLGDATSSGNTLAWNSAFDLNGATRTINNGSATWASTISGVIRNSSGTPAGLVKTGAGTLILSGANTFNGATTISAGILSLTAASGLALQNSALDTANSVAGGAAAGLKTDKTTMTLGGLSGDKNFADVFTTSSGGYSAVTALTLNPAAADNLSYSGVIANGAVAGMTLTKSGLGTQTLSGVNTYTGATAVQGGTLRLGGGSLANTAVTLSGTSTFGVQPGAATAISLGNSSGAVSTGGALTLIATSIFDMTDGAVSSFDIIGHATTPPTALTAASGTTWKFDVGSASADQVSLYKGATVTGVAAITGTQNVSLSLVTGTTSLTPGTYDLIKAGSGLAGTWQLAGSASGNLVVGSDVYPVSLSSSATAVTLTVSPIAGSTTATKLAFTTQPSANTAISTVFAQQPVVQIQDASSNPVALAGVSITLSGVPGLAGTVTVVTDASGTATFSGLSVTTAGSGLVLTASGGSLTVGNSSAFNIIATGNGIYTQTTSGGNWSGAGNWSGGTIASGSGNSANFNTLDISADNTVHLDFPVTLTSLSFGDTASGTTAGWTVDDNSSSLNTLTLAGTTPSITVNALGGTKTTTISAAIAGSTAWSKVGAGTLTLSSGNNSFTGITTITGGTLSVGTIGAITVNSDLGAYGSAGAAGLVLNGAGATLKYTGSSAATTRGFTGTATPTFDVATLNQTLTLGASSLAATTLTVNSSGGGGTLALGALTISASGATLTPNTGNLTVASATGATFNLTLSGSDVGAGTVVGVIATTTGTLTKSGTGTWTLSGANTHSGVTTITAGTLTLANQLAVQSSTVTMGGGAGVALVFDQSVVGNAFTFGGLSAAAAGAGYDIDLRNNAGSPAAIALTVGANSSTYAGVLSGTGGSLIKSGAGTLTLSGDNSYSGGTTLSVGTLAIGHNNALGTGTITLNGGTTIQSSAATARTLANAVVLGGDFTVGGTGNLTFSNTGAVALGGNRTITVTTSGVNATFARAFSGAFTITKAGAGTLTLSGNNSHSVGTTISGGKLIAVGASAIGTGTITMGTASSTLHFQRDSSFTVANVWSFPTRSITQTIVIDRETAGAADNWTVSQNLAQLSGNTMIWQKGANVTSGTPTVNLSSGIATSDSTAGTYKIEADGVNLRINNMSSTRSLTTELAGNTTGNEVYGSITQNNGYPRSLLKTGTGTWTLSGPLGAAPYNNGTTITAGKLALGANNVFATMAFSIGSATLDAATFTDTVGTLDVTGSAVINLGTGGALAFADSSAVNWAGGTLTITGTFVPGSSLRFGTTSGGLIGAQIALISSEGWENFSLDASGYLTATESVRGSVYKLR